MATILVIDDDDQVRALFRSILEDAGHHVLEARTGNEGLCLFWHTFPDLVITDVLMPDGDGLEVTQTLHHDAPEVPVIALTAHVKREDAQRCLDAGCVLHLSKPVDTRTLPETVQEVIAQAGEAVT